jgi:hypothetical protein
MNSGKPQTYEAGIYNKEVVDLLKIGQRHRHLKDEWAEVHYFKTQATSEDEARRRLAAKYPPEQGYVIDGIFLLSDD